MTLWDMQTGLDPHFHHEIRHPGYFRFLDRKLSRKLFIRWYFWFWDVENGREGSRFLGEPVVSVCWLEPENQVA